MIYSQKGTKAQLEAWVQMADRQLAALLAQQTDLALTIADLQTLRDPVIE